MTARFPTPARARARAERPVLVTLAVTAREWRTRLGADQRAPLERAAGSVTFPEDGTEALAVLGPLERWGLRADLVRELVARAGVRLREAVVDEDAEGRERG